MYNLFMKNNGKINCVAVRKGARPGLCFMVNNTVYNIITKAQESSLRYKLNDITRSVVYKTPGIIALGSGSTLRAVTFFDGSYQIITPSNPISCFIASAGVFISNQKEEIIDDKYKISYNGLSFTEKALYSDAIWQAILGEIQGYDSIDSGGLVSIRDNGDGSVDYAYEVVWRFRPSPRILDTYYTYALIHLDNFEDAVPTLISIGTFSNPQKYYYDLDNVPYIVNGFVLLERQPSDPREYYNEVTGEFATLPVNFIGLIYDPISQYYYTIDYDSDYHIATLKRTKDIVHTYYTDWETCTVALDSNTTIGIRSMGSSDLP